MAERIDPLRNFRFRLEIGNLKAADFAEVAIGEATVDVVDYRVGTDPPHLRRLTGLSKYANIQLKSGATTGANGLELFNWHKDVSTGQVKTSRKDVAIVVQDEAGVDAARFVVSNAWPVKYDPSDLNAKGNEVLIELLELVHEGIERTV